MAVAAPGRRAWPLGHAAQPVAVELGRSDVAALAIAAAALAVVRRRGYCWGCLSHSACQRPRSEACVPKRPALGPLTGVLSLAMYRGRPRASATSRPLHAPSHWSCGRHAGRAPPALVWQGGRGWRPRHQATTRAPRAPRRRLAMSKGLAAAIQPGAGRGSSRIGPLLYRVGIHTRGSDEAC